MKTSLLLPGKDVPDDDGLRVILSVHQGAKSHQVPATEGTPTHLLHASNSSHVKVTVVWVWQGPVHAAVDVAKLPLQKVTPGTSEAARTAAKTRVSSTFSKLQSPPTTSSRLETPLEIRSRTTVAQTIQSRSAPGCSKGHLKMFP